MKRRRFLKRTGWMAAGGASTLIGRHGLAHAQAEVSRAEAKSEEHPPRVLVTSADSNLARFLGKELRPDYRLRLTGRSTIQTDFEFTASALDADAATADLVRGMDAVVHVAEPPAGATDIERMDYRTRSTFNLLQAAAREQVRLVVYLSSIELLAAYPNTFSVDEDWRPLPGSDPELLSHYLGEFTCREFAREGRIIVAVLRLGTVVRAEEVQGKTVDPLWVDQRDVAAAVHRTVQAGLARETPTLPAWSVFHILSGSSHSRFSIAAAKRVVGYQPRFSW